MTGGSGDDSTARPTRRLASVGYYVALQAVRIGQRVAVTFDGVSDRFAVPRFTTRD
jgi:hypothetical protein